MTSKSISEHVAQLAQRTADELKLELVLIEVVGAEHQPIVRVFIDKPAGVTHDDCAGFSRHIGELLDAEDIVPTAYTLEVSSPGLERPLLKLEDYVRFSGQSARLKTRAALNGQRNFRGRIESVNADRISFMDSASGKVEIPFVEIAKANLEIDVEAELRRAKQLNIE